ncbi:MAG: LEA type 2 family protein [Treponema sp.]|jgi:LEA14-like dessication related protein|nr:LEA type 2 family protein [Treponema sp.]
MIRLPRAGIAAFWLSLVLLACRSVPGSAPPPASLVFDHPQASDPDTVTLHFTLTVENNRDTAADLSLAGYKLILDGREPAEGSSLEPVLPIRLPPRQKAEIPLRLKLDLKKALPDTADTAGLVLTTHLDFAFGRKKMTVSPSAAAEFSPVRKPVFEIISIAVMQAELINTRFRVRIRISNLNPFPVNLSSFQFELYGAGRLWAEGTEKNTITVPAAGSAEKELFLKMNFIDMRRDLLDQVINMERIRYRFSGAVKITTARDYLPVYTGSFNLEGESEVIR